MMKRMKSHSGFSITEVVVAALIFMIVAAGTFSVFSMARQQSVASDKEIIATYRGHELLESLRAHVDARSWDHDDWAGLTCDPQGDAVTRDWPGQTHQGYPIQYQCELFADGFLRKVTVIVPWDD